MNNMHKAHLLPSQLILDGKYTKILKAFADANNLQFIAEYQKTNFGLGVEVAVIVENRYFQSVLDVFKHGQIAYVSSMREFTQDAQEDTIEQFSQKIINGMIGEGLYLQSLKGGNGYMLIDGKLQFIDKWTMECPKSFEELLMQIDLAGIDWHQSKIDLKKAQL